MRRAMTETGISFWVMVFFLHWQDYEKFNGPEIFIGRSY